MCNCIKEIEERFKNRVNEMPEHKDLKVKSTAIKDVVMMLESGKELTGTIVINHEPVKRKFKTEIGISFKYCPFCGEKYSG